MPAGRSKPIELPKDKALVAKWRRLLDPKETSIKEFIETYKVPTKRVASLAESRAQTPFREYPLQTRQRATIEWHWQQGKGGKIASGKGRQEGMTTDADLLVWERFMRGGGGTANVFSYDTDATKESLRLFHAFKRQTPPWVFTHLMHGGGGKWRRESALQLEIVFPDGTTCMIQCLTAGDKSSGSGSSPRWLLWDEFPKWKPEIKRNPTSMSEGWLDAPGNFWIVQGTGQGNDEYAEFFMSIWGKKSDSGFEAIFPERGWLGHPDRREEFEDEEQKAAFIAKIATDRSYGIKQEKELVAMGAVPEELLWRRRKVSGVSFKWDLDLFSQEFPMVPSDMFRSAARSVFHAQIEILKSHERAAAEKQRAATPGELEYADGRIQFFAAPHGPWTLFVPPTQGGLYCFGADPASGKTRLAASNKEPDFAMADVGEVYHGGIMAQFRAHADGRNFGGEVFKAACFFNGAKGYIERNQFGESAIHRFEDLENAQNEFSGMLLRQDNPILSDGKRMESQTGWITSLKSREILIDAVREYLIEVGLYDPARGVTPLDVQFVTEALVFERDEKGRAEAARGHDDAVFAKALRELARERILREGHVPVQSLVKKHEDLDEVSLFWLGVEEQRKAARRRAPGQVVTTLGRAF